MSWLDKAKNQLIIRLGDGSEHRPKWNKAARAKEYNISEFEFPDLDGTLVYRGRPKGTRYNLEFFFDGEDHLDFAQDFWDRANDSRDWTITHPYYGAITIQVISLNQENSQYNVSIFTASVIETITEDAPKTEADPADKIGFDKGIVDDNFAVNFSVQPPPTVTDRSQLSQDTATIYNLGRKRVLITEDAEEYFNLFNQANAAISNVTAEPLAAMRAIQSVINYPSFFQDSVYNRLSCLYEQFDVLRLSVETIVDPSKKRIFQFYLGGLLSSMAVASATPLDGDYQNRDQVFGVMDQILSRYDTYITDLDSLQTENGGDKDSFIPDADSIISLSGLINFTVSNLFTIAINSRSERTIILEDDSNLILLAHRFYGLVPDDSTITQFMDQNQIGLNEILGIKKGRTIKYYV